MTLQESIEALKKAAQHEKDLQKVWNAFFDLTFFPEFLKNSTGCRHDTLESLLSQIFSQLPNAGNGMDSLLIVRYGDSSLYHGPFRLGNLHATFFYFEDIGIGLSVTYTGGANVQMSRFGVQVIPTSGFSPWQEPGSGVSVH